MMRCFICFISYNGTHSVILTIKSFPPQMTGIQPCHFLNTLSQRLHHYNIFGRVLIWLATQISPKSIKNIVIDIKNRLYVIMCFCKLIYSKHIMFITGYIEEFSHKLCATFLRIPSLFWTLIAHQGLPASAFPAHRFVRYIWLPERVSASSAIRCRLRRSTHPYPLRSLGSALNTYSLHWLVLHYV